jgi:uncharacterized protein
MTQITPCTVLITGGTGFIGRTLCQVMFARGWQVLVWRHRSALPETLRGVVGITALEEIPANQHIDAVVNLAGARILGPPWTKRRRRILLESRVGTTTALVEWLKRRQQRPARMVSASAVGYYGVRGAEHLNESAQPQSVFQSEICRLWEESALRCVELGVRCVLPRFGVVLGLDGGALPAFTTPARLGLAAVMGDGNQGFAWIHIEDAIGIILWALKNDFQGAVNAVAPGLVSQREFQQTLSAQLHRRLWLRIPAWPVRLALGEMAQLLIDGQYVEPDALLGAGFQFRHPDLPAALQDLIPTGR